MSVHVSFDEPRGCSSYSWQLWLQSLSCYLNSSSTLDLWLPCRCDQKERSTWCRKETFCYSDLTSRKHRGEVQCVLHDSRSVNEHPCTLFGGRCQGLALWAESRIMSDLFSLCMDAWLQSGQGTALYERPLPGRDPAHVLFTSPALCWEFQCFTLKLPLGTSKLAPEHCQLQQTGRK